MADLIFYANSGEVALVASTAKTCLQIQAPTNQRVLIRAIRILGKQPAGGTDTPVKVRLTKCVTVNPPAAPSLSVSTGSNNIANNTYYCVITYVTAAGETTQSLQTSITTSGGSTTSINVASPASNAYPDNVTKYKVYIGTTSGGPYYIQNGTGTNVGTNLAQTSYTGSGSNPPTTNGTLSLGTGTAGAGTIQKENPVFPELLQSVMAANFTGEPSGPVDTGLWWEFQPQSGIEEFLPLARPGPITIGGGQAANFELTSTGTPTIIITLTCEE